MPQVRVRFVQQPAAVHAVEYLFAVSLYKQVARERALIVFCGQSRNGKINVNVVFFVVFHIHDRDVVNFRYHGVLTYPQSYLVFLCDKPDAFLYEMIGVRVRYYNIRNFLFIYLSP